MQCVKCGRDTTENQVFCDSCLQSMDAYPVDPGTPVHLPHRNLLDAKKQNARKRIISQEEQILHLRKHLRRSRLFAVILAVLLCAASAMLLYELLSPDGQVIGQNYTINTSQPEE